MQGLVTELREFDPAEARRFRRDWTAACLRPARRAGRVRRAPPEPSTAGNPSPATARDESLSRHRDRPCILLSLHPSLPASFSPCILLSLHPSLPASFSPCILPSLCIAAQMPHIHAENVKFNFAFVIWINNQRDHALIPYPHGAGYPPRGDHRAKNKNLSGGYSVVGTVTHRKVANNEMLNGISAGGTTGSGTTLNGTTLSDTTLYGTTLNGTTANSKTTHGSISPGSIAYGTGRGARSGPRQLSLPAPAPIPVLPTKLRRYSNDRVRRLRSSSKA